jgi:uroporphyrinogen-III synthase
MDANQTIRSILITQAAPSALTKSPYANLIERFGISVDFVPFIQIQGIDYKQFRKQKINISDYTAIIFTSKHSIDNFFRITKEAKIEISPEVKYFCISEQTTNYLQKYIVMRKRKLFTGQKNAADLIELIKKFKSEKFLYPCSAIRRDEIPMFLAANGFNFAEGLVYETIPSSLTDLQLDSYQMIVFFSPSGITSLKHNFPNYTQGQTKFAAFGSTTASALTENGYRLDLEAPLPNAPSMAGAIEKYLESHLHTSRNE